MRRNRRNPSPFITYQRFRIDFLRKIPPARLLPNMSCCLSAEALAQAGCVVLTTNHKDFDVDFIKTHAKLIVDMRNMVKKGNDQVVKL